MRRALAVVCAALSLSACRRSDAAAGDPPGFDGPSAAVHDAIDDVYLVSNVRGAPLAKDGNGYIARVSPKDRSMVRYWIEGGRNGVTLHAPKGMSITGDTLWVADIDTVRAFDRTSGAPLHAIEVPGASCLQDVAASADGLSVFVSDAGLDANEQQPGTDAIWRLTHCSMTFAQAGSAGVHYGPTWVPEPLVRGPQLGQPRGLVVHKHSVYFVSGRDGTFGVVEPCGAVRQLAKAATAQLVGLVRVEGRDGVGPAAWITSSQAGHCLYRFGMCGSCTPLPNVLDQAGDCGFDARRRLLLVPLTGVNKLEFVSL